MAAAELPDAGHTDAFARLRQAAVAAMGQAYAPYSKFPVGAAALLDHGEIISGANVENASYGLTLCAETSMVAALPQQRKDDTAPLPKLRAVAVVNQQHELIMPCGRCRQVLAEFADEHTVVLAQSGPVSLGELLPMAFGPTDLDQTHGKENP